MRIDLDLGEKWERVMPGGEIRVLYNIQIPSVLLSCVQRELSLLELNNSSMLAINLLLFLVKKILSKKWFSPIPPTVGLRRLMSLSLGKNGHIKKEDALINLKIYGLYG